MDLRSADDYLEQAEALLPHGPAWSVDESGLLAAFLHGLSQAAADIDLQITRLVSESIPTGANDLLPEWEKDWGLPDPCMQLIDGDDFQMRVIRLAAKVRGLGGNGRQFFIDLAKQFGYDVTLDDPKPLRAGFCAGDFCYDEMFEYVWYMKVPAGMQIRVFDANSEANQPLRDWGDLAFECVIKQYKPDHEEVFFEYGA